MLTYLSIMIGMYIITRMIYLLVDKEKLSIVTTLFAAATILATLYCVFNIIKAGGEIADLFPNL